MQQPLVVTYDPVRSAENALENWKIAYRIVAWMYCLPIIVLLFIVPTASRYEYSYQIPRHPIGNQTVGSPGQLYTTWWSIDYTFTAMLPLFFFLPVSMFDMKDNPLRATRRIVRAVFLAVMIVLWLIPCVWWSTQMRWTNADTAINNPGNDPKWCCIYANLPNSGCAQPNNPCIPGVNQSDLSTFWVFIVKFGFVWALWVFMIIDLCVQTFAFAPMVDVYTNLLIEKMKEDTPPPSAPAPVENKLMQRMLKIQNISKQNKHFK
jgi:hypothetical protein